MLISLVSLFQELVVLICQYINGVFFERKKILVFIEKEKDTSIHFVQILLTKSSYNSSFEEFRVKRMLEGKMYERLEIRKFEVVECGLNGYEVGGVCEILKERRKGCRFLFDFHVQLFINTIFQIIDVRLTLKSFIVRNS